MWKIWMKCSATQKHSICSVVLVATVAVSPPVVATTLVSPPVAVTTAAMLNHLADVTPDAPVRTDVVPACAIAFVPTCTTCVTTSNAVVLLAKHDTHAASQPAVATKDATLSHPAVATTDATQSHPAVATKVAHPLAVATTKLA